MMMLLKELIAFDKRILSSATLFKPVLIDLKTKYNLATLIEAYEKDLIEFKLEQVMKKEEFINDRLSAIIDKHVSVKIPNLSIYYLGPIDIKWWTCS